MADYTGVKVVNVEKDLIDRFYKDKELEIWDNRYTFYQNEYVVLKNNESSSALGRFKNNKIVLLSNTLKACNITPKNKEQVFAMDALLDDNVSVVVLTGRAGSGKTLMSLAAAIQKVEEGAYKRIVLSRPRSQVGRYDLGLLPGDVNDKFLPYMQSFACNLDLLIGEHKNNLETFIEQYNAEFIPIQLMRGASFMKSFIIIDESQVLNEHEILTLGTRIVDGSKLVILGDLKQRDEKIPISKTGIYNFINDERAKSSDFVASIQLLKSERGRIATLFADIFEEK